ncbi:MAG: hypothetical protein U5K84_01060 [Alkalibacterium sp.]|nr:hypothetical protein [Alkalibacterium sp.]
MVETSLKEIDVKNCRVFAYDGLTAKFAEDNDINVLIRGIRSVKDFEYERDIAELNAMQSEAIETVFLIADSKYQSVSSTMVKEIAYYGGELQELVPAHVDDRVKKASQKVEK